MGSILQTFLRALSSEEHAHQFVTVGCCSSIRIEDHEENVAPIKDDDSSDLGGLTHARVGN
jgi:hypothetical protein